MNKTAVPTNSATQINNSVCIKQMIYISLKKINTEHHILAFPEMIIQC